MDDLAPKLTVILHLYKAGRHHLMFPLFIDAKVPHRVDHLRSNFDLSFSHKAVVDTNLEGLITLLEIISAAGLLRYPDWSIRGLSTYPDRFSELLQDIVHLCALSGLSLTFHI